MQQKIMASQTRGHDQNLDEIPLTTANVLEEGQTLSNPKMTGNAIIIKRYK